MGSVSPARKAPIYCLVLSDEKRIHKELMDNELWSLIEIGNPSDDFAEAQCSP
jgi:hypothetical protein